MEAPEAGLHQIMLAQVAVGHRLLVLTVQALQLGMVVTELQLVSLAVALSMQAVVVVALMLAARQVQAAQAAVVLDQIQALPEPMELPTREVVAARDHNIVVA